MWRKVWGCGAMRPHPRCVDGGTGLGFGDVRVTPLLTPRWRACSRWVKAWVWVKLWARVFSSWVVEWAWGSVTHCLPVRPAVSLRPIWCCWSAPPPYALSGLGILHNTMAYTFSVPLLRI